jgi:hypothetical protein
MEHEGSLPYSQEPNISPYPEPHNANALPQLYLFKIHVNVIFPFKSRSP